MNKEASFTFTTPLTVNIVEIKGEEHLFVEGDISTTDIDLVNDIMTKECQESMQRQIMERSMKLDLEHEAFKGNTSEEKEINKTKIPAGKLIDATVKDLGSERYSTRVKGEINRHRKDYANIKGNLLEGYLDAFSVAFLATDVKYEKREGKSVRLLNDVILLNVALTGNPCNTKAQMTEIISKSMDALELYKKQKEIDPNIENALIVKNAEGKAEYPWDKCIADQMRKYGSKDKAEKICGAIRSGTVHHKDVESYFKILHVLNDSTSLAGDPKLKNKEKSKMTDENGNPEGTQHENGEGNGSEQGEGSENGESVEAEKKALQSVQADIKSLNDKYDAVLKDNESVKKKVEEVSKTLNEIKEALSKPVHKSIGTPKPAETKAGEETKSDDPLKMF